MSKPTVVYFGSFLQYSAHILEQLHTSGVVDVVAVVTTPPGPSGRDQLLQKTHVHQFAETNNLPVFTPEKLNKDSLNEFKHQISNIKHSNKSLNVFVVAGYGKLLPQSWLSLPTIAPINIHFSLLPKYRGAMPGEWAIFMGEHTTGITLIEMSTKFDTGAIFAQAEATIESTDTRESLYKKLYALGAQTFLETLPYYLNWKNKILLTSQLFNQLTKVFLPPQPQTDNTQLYAHMVHKDETYIPWNLIQKAIKGEEVPPANRPGIFRLTTDNWPLTTERSIRSFKGWPGVWTQVLTKNGEKRLKIHTAHILQNRLVLDQVQLEGQQISAFDHVAKHYLLTA